MKHAAPTTGDERITSPWRTVLVCALIVLAGFNLRAIILAVPPVLPFIQRDLQLSYTETGLLTALPTLVLGCASWFSGLLAERIGPRACVTIGLVLLAVGSILRAFWPTVFSLFLFTVLLSLGIAVAQTAAPILTRRWFPLHIGIVSALFTDGLIIGETAGAGITVPLMGQVFGKDAWATTFIFWGVPVVVLLALWLWLTPPASATGSASRPLREGVSVPTTTQDGAPSIKPARVNRLHLGIMLGANSLIYFGMNGWIAPYNQAIQHAELTPFSLTVLNAAQLPVSLGVTFFAQRLAGRRWPFVATGVICAVAIAGWVFTPAELEPLWAALLGGSSAFVFTLGIALPPLLAKPNEVARLTGLTLSLTYIVAFVGPFVGGQLWDILHLPAVAFLPVAIASVTLMILGALLPSRAAFNLGGENRHHGEKMSDPATMTPPAQ